MRFLCSLLPFLLIASTAGTFQAESTSSNVVLTTTAELRALTNDGPIRFVKFQLVGTVVYSLFARHYTLQDKTGTISFFSHSKEMPTLGDLISVSGYANLSPKQANFHHVTELTILGSGFTSEPRDLTIGELLTESDSNGIIRTTGHVVDAFQDEIDARYKFLTLSDGKQEITVSVYCPIEKPFDLQKIRDAEISVTGCSSSGLSGSRMLHMFNIATRADDIRILTPAPADPFDVETIDLSRRQSAREALSRPSRRRVDGTVTAVWHGNRFLVDTDNYRTLQISLAPDTPPPKVGMRVTAVGRPGTDFFTVNLSGAIWRPVTGAPRTPDEPIKIVNESRFIGNTRRQIMFNPRLHGCPVQIRGYVRNVSLSDFNTPRMHVEYGHNVIPVDASSCPESLAGVENGCEVEVTGICLMETDTWQPKNHFPHVRGFFMILRSAADVKVLSRPPWWTPERLLIVLGTLFAALVGVFIWNRILNRIVERRSRELLKEQIAHSASELRIGERTRLAVELHDSLSQNLAGVACQVAATRNAIGADDEVAKRRLLTAEQMLKSCRTELRHCLFDLRSDMLEEPDFAVAVRKTLDQLDTEAEITVDVDIPRARLLDSTAHALLCIVRELVSNALRHGQAKHVQVAGHFNGPLLSFSVHDDGCGFDPENCKGAAEGHFGIDGIRDRLKKLNGRMEVKSAAGSTTATVTLVLAKDGKDLSA